MLFDSRIFDEKRFIKEDPMSGDQLWFVPRDSFLMKGLWFLYNNAAGHNLTPVELAKRAGGQYKTSDTFDNEGVYIDGSFSEVDDILLAGVYGRDYSGGDTNKQRFLDFINE